MADSEDAKYRLIERLQDEVGRRLHSLPGINGSAIGRGDESETSEIGLVVFTDSPKRTSGTDEVVQIVNHIQSNGVTVHFVARDLRTVPIPTILLDERTDADARPDAPPSRDDVFNPIIGGISCGPDVTILKAPWSGTLGLVVNRRSAGKSGLLSNCHVMFYDSGTKTVTQPARIDSIFNYNAGHELSVLQGNVAFLGRATYVDAAVATLDDDRTATRRKLFPSLDVTGVRASTHIKVGDAVSKSGLTTGLTTGKVKYTSVSGPGGSEPNQFAIEGDGGMPFCAAGDSGSVVLYGSEVMGLLWGSNSDQGVDYAIVTPIEAVTQSLDIEI